jgi:diguanylate cyclase (GGDEF)-like protein
VKSVRHGLFAVAGCALLLIFACAAVVLAVHRMNELADAQEYVGDKLYGVRQVYETLQAMESSQRGYLLTGNIAYLDPYQRDSASMDTKIATFERLYQGDDAARPLVTEILPLARGKQAELADTIALARAGGRDAAMAIVNGNRGKELMDEFDKRLLALIAEQRGARTQFVDEGRATLRYLYQLGAVVGVLIMALVAIAVRSLTISIARLDDAQKAEEHNAMHDALTGLPNRRYLSEWMATALAAARRAARELHVLYFDLDGFKAVNDELGHEAGDRVLRVTASRLRETLRSSDFIARLGGDEFVAVLPQTDAPPSVGALIARIEEKLNTAPIEELPDGSITASIGRASFPRDGETVTALLVAADRSMYNIKEMRKLSRAQSERGAPTGRPLGRQQPA